MLPPVCLSPRNVKGSLICSISSAGMKLKNVSGIYRTFHNEDRWSTIQTITKRCQFSCRWYNFPSKKCNFLPRGEISLETLLMAKKGISMLYFSPNSLLTLHRIDVWKKQNIDFLPVAILARDVCRCIPSQKSGIRFHHVCRGCFIAHLRIGNVILIEPHHDKIYLRTVRPGNTQTNQFSCRD